MMLGSIITILLLLSFSLQMAYMLFFWANYLSHQRAKIAKPTFSKAVSIIICARNESANLQRNIPLIAEQNYLLNGKPNFEIVLVNDDSSDDSLTIMHALSKRYPIIRIINREKQENERGKKWALHQGILAANNEHLLLTDADCWPAHKNWIQSMCNGFIAQTEVVLGYSPYSKQSTLLSDWIDYETLFTALQYFSLSHKNLTFMGVGRNIAYTKSCYLKYQNLDDHGHLASGDDDLFIKQVYNHSKINIIDESSAYTYSNASENWKIYFYQKSRHLSTANHYRWIHKLLLGIYPFSTLIFFASLLLSIFLLNYFVISIVIYLARMMVLLIIIHFAKRRGLTQLNYGKVFYLDIIQLFYFFLFIPSSFGWTKNEKW